MKICSGLYRHYKGNEYYLFQLAHHSETREPLAIYQCLYGDYSWWVRPLAMFIGTVEVGGESIPRFQFIRPLNLDEIAAYAAGNAAEGGASV